MNLVDSVHAGLKDSIETQAHVPVMSSLYRLSASLCILCDVSLHAGSDE